MGKIASTILLVLALAVFFNLAFLEGTNVLAMTSRSFAASAAKR